MSNDPSHDPEARRRGLMLVISSPSGAGKSTLSRRLMAEDKVVSLSVSATTRAPRPDEVDGAHYHFLEKAAFEAKIDSGGFLEWAKVFDHYYGSPRADTERKLAAGTDVIFDVDWQGADALHDQMPNDVVSIFVLPPSIDALEKRLLARPGSTAENVARRMRDARSEISHWRRYDYCIVNDNLDVAFNELCAILVAERLKRLRRHHLDPLVRKLLA
ncbi:MAG: guanylate kinase [Pseudomonadota bacterium]